MSAAGHWRAALESWAIPDALLAEAPENPWRLDVAAFQGRVAPARATDTPSRRRAMAALPIDGEVLDVGSGAGAASLALAPPAAAIVAVDQREDMLRAFATQAEGEGLRHLEVVGRWPDVAEDVPAADVVLAHHVVYNVPDLDRFLARLTDHARSRVVVELTREHPLAWTRPFWQRLHGLDRPAGPTAEDAAAVAAEQGLSVDREDFRAPFRLADAPPEDLVAFLRRHLCLPEDRDDDVAAAVAQLGVPTQREVATLWWAGTAERAGTAGGWARPANATVGARQEGHR